MELPEILVQGLRSAYEPEHLARVFFPGAKLRVGATTTRGPLVYARAGHRRLAAGVRLASGQCAVALAPRLPGAEVSLQLCRLLYGLLKSTTGLRPPWGLLTGVRPVNHLRKRIAQGGEAFAESYFVDTCDVSREKYTLAREILVAQQPLLDKSGSRSYSLYISIPFCPTRCSYCSFVSRTIQREGHLVRPYLEKLVQELAFTAQSARALGLRLETLYIGGGTPTALDARQLDTLLAAVAESFDTAAVQEYTVEAGRPDCTDREKLALMKSYGVGRVSINPQSFNDDVLQRIGRSHTAQDVYRCFEDARRAGHDNINMDLIAGLPGDDAAGFEATLKAAAGLAPENITVHTLTLKRASDLVVQPLEGSSSPGGMVAGAGPFLRGAGYAPYYLYRQKSGVENLENTGWARPGMPGVYNVYIMEEAHTILAVGAGASTKLVCGGADEKTIKRLYSPKFPADYIQSIDEVLAKKRGVDAFYARYLDT